MQRLTALEHHELVTSTTALIGRMPAAQQAQAHRERRRTHAHAAHDPRHVARTEVRRLDPHPHLLGRRAHRARARAAASDARAHPARRPGRARRRGWTADRRGSASPRARAPCRARPAGHAGPRPAAPRAARARAPPPRRGRGRPPSRACPPTSTPRTRPSADVRGRRAAWRPASATATRWPAASPGAPDTTVRRLATEIDPADRSRLGVSDAARRVSSRPHGCARRGRPTSSSASTSRPAIDMRSARAGVESSHVTNSASQLSGTRTTIVPAAQNCARKRRSLS